MGNNGQRRAITSRAMVAFKGIPPPLYVSTSGRGDRKVANSRSGLAQPSSQVLEFSGYLVPGQPRLLPKEDSSHRRGSFGFGAGFLLFTPPFSGGDGGACNGFKLYSPHRHFLPAALIIAPTLGSERSFGEDLAR